MILLSYSIIYLPFVDCVRSLSLFSAITALVVTIEHQIDVLLHYWDIVRILDAALILQLNAECSHFVPRTMVSNHH
jgi:hypothetical protein